MFSCDEGVTAGSELLSMVVGTMTRFLRFGELRNLFFALGLRLRDRLDLPCFRRSIALGCVTPRMLLLTVTSRCRRRHEIITWLCCLLNSPSNMRNGCCCGSLSIIINNGGKVLLQYHPTRRHPTAFAMADGRWHSPKIDMVDSMVDSIQRNSKSKFGIKPNGKLLCLH